MCEREEREIGREKERDRGRKREGERDRMGMWGVILYLSTTFYIK